jgi:Mn2+/Fe2+ NRAMP family transporter
MKQTSLRSPSREELVRLKDRVRIEQAHRKRRLLALFWLTLGPGVLVMLGENDAPSMLSYAATGAKYGLGFFLPFVLLTFAMAFVVQEITVRLGAVTKTGHAELIYRRFGRFWGHFSMVDLLITNFLTLVTEFLGVAAGASFFGIKPVYAVVLAAIIVLLTYQFRRYWSWERALLALAAINLVFIPVGIMVHPLWGQVATSFLTFSPLPKHVGSTFIVILLSDIGATVTPWMLFFQQAAVSDKGLLIKDITWGRLDTAVGAVLAAASGIFTIIATSVLFDHHITATNYNAAQFAQALVPYAGKVAGVLFALGIMEAGTLAAIAIATSTAYSFGEVTNTPHSLNASFSEAKMFYGILFSVVVLAATLVLIPGIPLIYIILSVNVLAVLTMPPALVFLLLLANDKDITGKYRNSTLLNVLGITVTIVIILAGLLFAVSSIINI